MQGKKLTSLAVVAVSCLVASLPGCGLDGNPNSLDWQLNALHDNWDVEDPADVTLAAYDHSEIGPHGEGDAVYLLTGVKGQTPAWLHRPAEPLQGSDLKVVNSIIASSGGGAIVGDVKKISCSPALHRKSDDFLYVCRKDADSTHTILFERIV